MPKPLVWMVSPPHSDFGPALAWLHEHARVEEVVTPVPGARAPHAVLFMASRPGLVSKKTVERFHRAVPLARLVALVGVFCEGELRSGQVCQGVARVYWHHGKERLACELGLAGAPDRWRPRSQNEIDDLLLNLGAGVRRRLQPELVAICTDDHCEFEALADACWITGRRSVWQEPGQPPHYHGADVLLVDGWRALSALRDRNEAAPPPPPAIVLADFPRPEDSQRVLTIRVLSRPFLIADLFVALDNLGAERAQIRNDSAA